MEYLDWFFTLTPKMPEYALVVIGLGVMYLCYYWYKLYKEYKDFL